MLGYLIAQGRGAADNLLAETAARLQAEGWPLAGAVQVNHLRSGADCGYDMDLHLLTGGDCVRISQNLGPLSRGCRLDAAGLEQAVGLVEQTLTPTSGPAPRLLILNKFGKQELEGRGFRPLIGQALGMGIPVLTSVGAGNATGFDAFADGMAVALEFSPDAVLDWCRAAMAAEV
jgi:hypothetical protein